VTVNGDSFEDAFDESLDVSHIFLGTLVNPRSEDRAS
jgi:hypothetical protein